MDALSYERKEILETLYQVAITKVLVFEGIYNLTYLKRIKYKKFNNKRIILIKN